MKSKRFTFIVIGLLLGLVVHILSSGRLYFSQNSSHAFFSTSMLLTTGFFIFAAIGTGLLVIAPLELAETKADQSERSLNWWWHIYLGGWVLLMLVGLEYLLLNSASVRIGSTLLEYTIFFFMIKNIFLIPAYLVEKQSGEKSTLMFSLGLLELLWMIACVGLFWMAGQMVPDFGS